MAARFTARPQAHLAGYDCGAREPEDWTARAPGLVSCVHCRWERDRPARAVARARAARNNARRKVVRTPPRPPFEKVPGVCSMCGAELEGRRRSWCSDGCVALWLIATNATNAHGQLVTLHGPRCWGCGAPSHRLEVDHVRPLWALDDLERLELRWWLPFNLQLLCPPCHRAKTGFEAGMRARGLRSPGPVGPDVRPLLLPLDGLSSA